MLEVQSDRPAGASQDAADPARPAWGGVAALSLSVFGLVAAEFLPPSVLTPLASDLGVSLGAAGQAVTATAVVGAIAALLVPVVTSRWDRRLVMLGLLMLLSVSNLMTAAAVNLPMLLAARVILGISLGGFWSMAAATAMRLVPMPVLPRAMSIVFTGVTVATVSAAPLGAYVGDVWGWRTAFLIAGLVGVLALAALWITLPKLKPTATAGLADRPPPACDGGAGLGAGGDFRSFRGLHLHPSGAGAGGAPRRRGDLAGAAGLRLRRVHRQLRRRVPGRARSEARDHRRGGADDRRHGGAGASGVYAVDRGRRADPVGPGVRDAACRVPGLDGDGRPRPARTGRRAANRCLPGGDRHRGGGRRPAGRSFRGPQRLGLLRRRGGGGGLPGGGDAPASEGAERRVRGLDPDERHRKVEGRAWFCRPATTSLDA
ncbi:MAG: MFS transporter [Phenylobacterium sp.]|nr:MFS transporter [Phenylobacterium sp.]